MPGKVVNLFGDSFVIPENNTQKVLDKINNSKKQETDVNKLLNRKNLDLNYRLTLIEGEVKRVLYKYINKTLTIKSKEDFVKYIDKAIENGIIAIDTETNNSLDPLTCKLMGLCLYTPGMDAAYIPINHVSVNQIYADMYDFVRFGWQLTESDCKEQLTRLSDNNVKILTHNGKFDYKVLLKTCNWRMPIYWDSYVAARLLDENEESAGLKQQYRDKIDPEQEKYDIENLFKNVLYEYVKPEIFALYSATDAFMTYKLYEWQLDKFKDESLKGVWHIFRDIEMPIVEVVAKMELEGIDLDKEYAKRLSDKYHKLVEDCDRRVNEEIAKLTPQINSWKLTKEATNKSVGKTGKVSVKSKAEQLDDPISLDSPTQLSILLYDILKAPQVSVKSPRGTGVDELNALYNKTNWNLIKLILEKRGLDKLLNTFIDKLPNDANVTDGRVHCELFPLGTDTGRFSSGNPNMQQIPRANIEIKPMFKAPNSSIEEVDVDSILYLNYYDEVETLNGWVKAKDIKNTDVLITNQGTTNIKDVIEVDSQIQIHLE